MKDYTHISLDDYTTVAGPDWPSYKQFQQHINVPDFVYVEIDNMLRPKEGYSHPTFCVLPFYGWEYPSNTSCCLLPPGANLSSIKSVMLNQQRPAECYKCWNLEDAGILSDRQIKNITLDHYTNIDLEQLIQQSQQDKNQIIHYKIDTSNTCNAACATCSDNSSSTWAKIKKQNQMPVKKTWRISPAKFNFDIDWKNAKSIIFRGGEPLLSATNFWVIEQLISYNNTDCFVSFVTNGSIRPSSKQLALLRQMKSVNFCYSIDGIDHVFEYLRWPLKWGEVRHNIDLTREQGFKNSVSYTISNLNILYHDQTKDWFRSQDLSYISNPVYSPNYFSPTALPNTVKQYIVSQTNCLDVRSWIGMDQNRDIEYQQFLKEIKNQDSWKGIKISDYLPELTKLLHLQS